MASNPPPKAQFMNPLLQMRFNSLENSLCRALRNDSLPHGSLRLNSQRPTPDEAARPLLLCSQQPNAPSLTGILTDAPPFTSLFRHFLFSIKHKSLDFAFKALHDTLVHQQGAALWLAHSNGLYPYFQGIFFFLVLNSHSELPTSTCKSSPPFYRRSSPSPYQ